MIRYTGTVLRVDGARAWVECGRTAACAACPGRVGCEAAAFGGAPAVHRLHAKLTGAAVTAGARVDVGVPSRSVLRAASLAYGLPLATLVGGAVAGELFSPLAGVAGAALGLWAGIVLGAAASPAFPVAPPVVLDTHPS
jgi:sigma-E factor negative regulatory protein RseC